MAMSQIIEDSPLRFGQRPNRADGPNPQEVYNERHRLALEELLSAGVDDFLDFLSRERIPNFLSDEEVRRIRNAAAAPPRCASIQGEDLEPGLSSSVDCSSLTYFPEVSDVEPPLLEIGWPAFTAGSYRGVTRAVAHFQPSYGENIYSCKEAARRLIRSAREVIAIVTDALTDLDIFQELQEACMVRGVPVYILLDQSCAHAFLKMCKNLGVHLDDLRQMRVRSITGTTYYMRSGARITGEVHERFMLIDGNRVATGSYRFDWSDGRLNSSNLIELSGQITEKFDEEFRILYAQSMPLNTRSGLDYLTVKQLATQSPHGVRERSVCLTSTPSRGPRALALQLQFDGSPAERCKPGAIAEPSGVNEEWRRRLMREEIAAGNTTPDPPADQLSEGGTRAVKTGTSCHASTQTSPSVSDSDTQTDLLPPSTRPLKETQSQPLSPKKPQPAPDATLKDCFLKLTKERQYHYSAIRSKLEHMVTALSARPQLADVTNMAQGAGARIRPGGHTDHLQEPNLRAPGECVSTGTWPRARCVH